MTAAAPKAHIQALDGLRGLAIAAVLIFHSFPDLTPEWNLGGRALNKIAAAGPFGVDLFFVLSGFLITGILVDGRTRARYFKNFYARRALRLFPVYYLYLLVLVTVVPLGHRLLHTSMEDYAGPWWWYVAYFCNWKPNNGWGDPGIGHIWSLAVEEQFYLLWPTVVFFARGRNLAWICGLLIVSATALRCHWSLQDVPWNRIYRLTITRWDTMAFGALAALALRSESYRERAARIAPTLVAAGTAAFLVLTVLAGGAEWSKGPIQTFGSTSASIAFAGLVLYAATRTSGPLYAVLCRPVLLSLGKYSYFIYVVHGLVISHVYWVGSYIMKRAPLSAVPLKLALFLLVNVGVFHVAKLSWRFFEAPVLKLKRHFEPRA